MMGDLGVHLQTMESDLTIRIKSDTTIIDGYAVPTEDAAVSFKGVITPISAFMAAQLGVHDRGVSVLYVRLSQDDCPALSIEDIIIDGSSVEWKIVREMDYSHLGNFKVFTIQRLNQ